MESSDWEDSIEFLEGIESDSGTTPSALNQYRESKNETIADVWIFEAIKFLFEERTSLEVITISKLVEYAKVFPIDDLPRFITIFRAVDKAVINHFDKQNED